MRNILQVTQLTDTSSAVSKSEEKACDLVLLPLALQRQNCALSQEWKKEYDIEDKMNTGSGIKNIIFSIAC